MTIVDRTRVGIATPHMFMDGQVDMALVGRYVRRAEELGYASFFNEAAPTEIYPLPLHAALPMYDTIYLGGQGNR